VLRGTDRAFCGAPAKGETVEEVAAAALVCVKWPTGSTWAGRMSLIPAEPAGRANTFNISTTAAFVVAAAGGKVAKHGGRSAPAVQAAPMCWKRRG